MWFCTLALAAELPGPWTAGNYLDLAARDAAVHATWVEGDTLRYARADTTSATETVASGVVSGDGGQMRPEILVDKAGRPVIVYSTATGPQVALREGDGWTLSALGQGGGEVLLAAAYRGAALVVTWLAREGDKTTVHVGTQRPREGGTYLGFSDTVFTGGADGVCMCCKPAIHSRAEELVLAFRDADGPEREIRLMSSKEGNQWTDMGKQTHGKWSPGGCPADGPVLTETTLLVSDARTGKRVIYEVSRQEERALAPIDATTEMLQPRALPDGSLLAWVEATPGMNRLVTRDGPSAPQVVAETAGRLEPGDPIVVGQDIWFPWSGERAHLERVETVAPPGF
ncbi:MAG: hypothetical protein FJ102_11070 [Deltaproteobacteria bacterium]|nr:hypothetical protein [Deltaproteobacteria bacterium]